MERLRAEGWLWVEAATELPYGHTIGLRRVPSETGLSAEEQASSAALQQEAEAIEADHAESEELPDAADRRLGEIEAMLAALDERPPLFTPEDVARAGAFVSLDPSGRLRIERGYVRPQDEGGQEGDGPEAAGSRPIVEGAATTGAGDPATDAATMAADDEAGASAISDRLMSDLTATRTLGLRDALARDPEAALLTLVHALALRLLYRGAGGLESCLEIEARHSDLAASGSALADNPAAAAISERHAHWTQSLPAQPGDLWDTLLGFDHDSRRDLLAHCTALCVNAVVLPYDRRPRALAHADRLASQVDLDMTRNFTPSAANYFGRTTKAAILAAVREAKGEASAQLIAHLRKSEMAAEAERLVAGTGWLPLPLRTSDATALAAPTSDGCSAPNDGPSSDLPAFLTEADEPAPDAGPWPVAAE